MSTQADAPRPSPLRAAIASVDRVWAALALAFAALALIDARQAADSAVFVADAGLGIAPFLLASVAFAAWAAATGADNLIAKAFSGAPAAAILGAALAGAVSPFCSCGVIPLIAALLAMGVPLAPVMAFWLASPVMDPSMFALTAGTLGVDFAVAKTLAALGLGLLGGFGTLALSRGGALSDPLREGVGNGGCGGGKVRAPARPVWRFWEDPARTAKFGTEARRSALFLAKWLLLAFLLESLMLAWVPAEDITSVLGGDGAAPVALAALVGVPAYLNGYAALPLVSGLMEQGMAPGAAMAFLVAGGVSSIPAAMAVWALAKPRVFALYLGFALTGALGAGFAWGAIA
ncbi:permease [Rhodovulum sp. DZ06]|uniref:permease n=1 Tax=Rhodovulum sp. DZ06 TaxID=3425126 RepID=UPI003D340E0E